jgi:hypothetical protein
MGEGRDDSRSGGGPRPPVELTHRGGTRVTIGTPIHIGGDKPWMCAAKLMGRSREASVDSSPDEDRTQTLLLRTGRGCSPEEAQRAALAELTHVYGLPGEPLPEPIIQHKPSEPPPSAVESEPNRGWLAKIAYYLGL